MNSKILLIIAGILILIGIIKPDFNFNRGVPTNHQIVVITAPSNGDLTASCEEVILALKEGGSSRKSDGRRLSSLYMDMALLIELDGKDQVIKNTEEIRQANSISGLLLQMNIRNKYPKLAQAAQTVIKTAIGDDNVVLNAELRAKAAEGFRALAWACEEGTK